MNMRKFMEINGSLKSDIIKTYNPMRFGWKTPKHIIKKRDLVLLNLKLNKLAYVVMKSAKQKEVTKNEHANI